MSMKKKASAQNTAHKAHHEEPRKPYGRTVRLGVVGLGTVGKGAVRVLLEHRHEIERRLGCHLELKKLCSRSILRQDLSWLGQNVEVTADWKQVVADPSIDIVIELVGELATARAIAYAAIAARKHLVTANKQLLAEYSLELAGRSRAAGVSLGIEACVAGGTPILHAIREGLAGEHFTAVYGILNGTTNYILTEMERRGCDYREALAEAQEKGYAEPDPTFDVEGYDARYKIAILSMLCFGQPVDVKGIPVEGITRIESVDFAYAHRVDHTIRLIAAARRHTSGQIETFVRPMMIPRSAQLAAVLGPINGILLAGNKGGETLVTGRGAGGEPTGVAVLSDVVHIARAILSGGGTTTPFGYAHWRPARIAPPGEHESAAYLRLVVRDRPGILARVCSILARHRINIDSVLQEPGHAKQKLPFVMTLEPVKEKQLQLAGREIARLPFLAAPPLILPFSKLP
ncbi:MAG TPA: homoserine dehydrogenase [Terriglobia bacterium]|nr:homoserine dehydrogenase [Terriglobia bacterium]